MLGGVYPMGVSRARQLCADDSRARVLRAGTCALDCGQRDLRDVELIRELERTRDETLKGFSLEPRDLARTYAPGKWSVGYILHHLSDSETVFFDRIRRVLSEPRQVLWVMDQDAWARGLDYSRVPLDISRRVYESVRNASSIMRACTMSAAATLSSCIAQTACARCGMNSIRSPLITNIT